MLTESSYRQPLSDPLSIFNVVLGWSEEHSGLLFLRLGTLLGGQSIGRR